VRFSLLLFHSFFLGRNGGPRLYFCTHNRFISLAKFFFILDVLWFNPLLAFLLFQLSKWWQQQQQQEEESLCTDVLPTQVPQESIHYVKQTHTEAEAPQNGGTHRIFSSPFKWPNETYRRRISRERLAEMSGEVNRSATPSDTHTHSHMYKKLFYV
jgi:hypothetical protein